MEFTALPQSEWSVFSRLSQCVSDVDEKCVKILGQLKEAFVNESMIGANVCSIDITRSANEFALIKSPVGNGSCSGTLGDRKCTLIASLPRLLSHSRPPMPTSGHDRYLSHPQPSQVSGLALARGFLATGEPWRPSVTRAWGCFRHIIAPWIG
jgi:hypothetical protein